MSTASYAFAVDWNNDGDFTDPSETVTTRVRGRSPVTIGTGRDQERALSPMASGTASFVLDNQSGDYSPENGASPLAGSILPARPVRIQATWSAVTYTLFLGYLDQFDLKPGALERSVDVGCLDAMATLRGARLSTPVYQGISTGEAIGYILDEVGWPSADRDLDTGATQIEWWWEEDTDAYAALEKVVQSEGPPAICYIDYSTGKFVFKDRHHRYLDAASLTSQATFRDTGTEPLFSDLEYDNGWRDIVNAVTIQVEERRVDGLASVVWSSSIYHVLGNSESRTFHIQADEPFVNAITPVDGTDYRTLTGSVTVSLSRTSGQALAVTLTGGASGGTIDDLQIRAYSVPVVRTRQVRTSDATSIAKYKTRSGVDVSAPWANVFDAEAIANLILRDRKDPLPIIKVTVKNGADSRLTQQLARQISDRVTVVDSETGLSDDFYIERIDHSISEAGKWHDTVFGLEKVPSGLAGNPFVLGTSTLNGTHTLVD